MSRLLRDSQKKILDCSYNIKECYNLKCLRARRVQQKIIVNLQLEIGELHKNLILSGLCVNRSINNYS